MPPTTKPKTVRLSRRLEKPPNYPSIVPMPTRCDARILLMGATGRTGVAILNEFTKPGVLDGPKIHAFARTPSKLPARLRGVCASLVRGDARSTQDVVAALAQTDPTHIVVAVGLPDSLDPTDVRKLSAHALVNALVETARVATVRVAVVSALGAGGSTINLGFGAGSLVQWMLRHQLKDHDAQERILVHAFEGYEDSLLIIRPTGLSDTIKRSPVLVLGDQRSPTWRIHREDLAQWLISRIVSKHDDFGGVVSITAKPS